MISGTGAVNQIGPGTTILTGDSTYTGGTTITAGTLQLGNGGTTGSIAGDVLNNGTLAFNRLRPLDLRRRDIGDGAVNQIGAGHHGPDGANSYAGDTTVSAGTLQAGATNTFSPNSIFTVDSGATLDLAGFDQTIPGLINQGIVRTGGSPDTRTGTILTVAGDYSAGSTLALNTVLAADGSPSDLLRIDGGTATGTTGVIVSDIGGGGALTTGDGILAIEAVNGGTTAPGAFGPTLALAGPYQYRLFRGNLSGDVAGRLVSALQSAAGAHRSP